MEPRQVKTAADARKIVKERGLSHVKVGVHDIDGILRGKYIHIDKFHSALDGGMGFCDVVLGWDANDQLYDNVTYTGWHTGYPDANVRILPETCREIATEPGNLLFLCEFVDRAEELCPRGVLRRVLARAAKMGFEVKVGFEYEFFVFAETAFSIREKGYKNLKPISPGFFGYSVLRNSVLSDLYKDLLAMCETMDMGIEGLHTETGAGVLEAALAVNDALRRGRQRGAVQALHQGAGAEARLARHLHGQMVEGLAGLRRPHAHVAVEGRQVGLLRREGAASHEHDHAPLRRRPAGADARAAGHGGGQR